MCDATKRLRGTFLFQTGNFSSNDSKSVAMEKKEDVLLINTQQSVSTRNDASPRRTGKLMKTIALCASFLGLGLGFAITGPTLPYLQDQVSVGVDQIGVIFVGRSVGYLVGSMGAGWLFDRFGRHHDLMFAISLLVISLTVVLMPWAASLLMLALLNTACGLAMGCVDTGGNAVCIRLWGPRSPPYMQALHFSFGLGSVLAPLIAAPFLENGSGFSLRLDASNETNESAASYVTSTLYLTQTNMITTSPDLNVYTTDLNSTRSPVSPRARHSQMFDSRIDNVQFVYLLLSSFVLSVALVFAAFEVRRHVTGEVITVVPKVIDTGQQKRTDKPFLITMLVLMFLFYCLYAGLEVSYGQFIATFAIEHASFSENDASLLTAVYWGVLTFGCGCAVLIARYLSPSKMLLGSFGCTLFALAFLCFALSLHPVILWVFSGVLGFGFSAIFPTGFTWGEEHLHVSGKIAAVFVVGASVGEMALPATMGYLIATVGSIYMMYAMMGFALFNSVIFLLMTKMAYPSCRSSKTYSVKGV